MLGVEIVDEVGVQLLVLVGGGWVGGGWSDKMKLMLKSAFN